MYRYRETVPIRSIVEPSRNYRVYKAVLRSDFIDRCGYCDGADEYYGGITNAHIDHFAPKKKFPGLKNCYDNLVYSCGFCNRAKSDKWIGNDPAVPNDGRQGFVDPCSDEYDTHLARLRSGQIVPRSNLGEYMVENLNLRLMRHQFIWQAQKLDRLAEVLEELRPLLDRVDPLYLELVDHISDIVVLYRQYRRRANAN